MSAKCPQWLNPPSPLSMRTQKCTFYAWFTLARKTENGIKQSAIFRRGKSWNMDVRIPETPPPPLSANLLPPPPSPLSADVFYEQPLIILAVIRQACKEFAGPISASLCPGNTPTQLFWKKCRSGGEPLATLFDLNGPRFEPQTSRSKDELVAAWPTKLMSGWLILSKWR